MTVTHGARVFVSPGHGRKWVHAASLRGDAYVERITRARVLVAYWTGSGRACSTWVPKWTVEPMAAQDGGGRR